MITLSVGLDDRKIQRLYRISTQLVPKQVARALNAALKKEATLWAKEMKAGIRRGAPGGGKALEPLKKSTKITRLLKGIPGKKPLIYTGELQRRIGYWQMGSVMEPVWFVGIKRGMRRRAGPGAGKDLAMIALHLERERTFTLRIPKDPPKSMWHFLRHLKLAGGLRRTPRPGKLMKIKIPARPFVQPVVDLLGPTLRKRVLQTFAQQLLRIRMSQW